MSPAANDGRSLVGGKQAAHEARVRCERLEGEPCWRHCSALIMKRCRGSILEILKNSCSAS